MVNKVDEWTKAVTRAYVRGCFGLDAARLKGSRRGGVLGELPPRHL